MTNELNKAISDAMRTLNQHIEEYACAFRQKVGLDPTELTLIHNTTGKGIEITLVPRDNAGIEHMLTTENRALHARVEELEAALRKVLREVNFGHVNADLRHDVWLTVTKVLGEES